MRLNLLELNNLRHQLNLHTMIDQAAINLDIAAYVEPVNVHFRSLSYSIRGKKGLCAVNCEPSSGQHFVGDSR